MDDATPFFTSETFRFLSDLAANNDRAWFEDNRARYDEFVKEPALEFIEMFGPMLESISPRFLAVAKVQGGSLFRIHRDTRFSKDKTPYKVNTGMQFRHERGKDAHAPGFYVHLEPGSSFWGVGMWRPQTAVAGQIRAYMAAHPERWQAATEGLELGGESLKRPPKGYDKDDPMIEDLKRKDFLTSGPLTTDDVIDTAFPETLLGHFDRGAPLARFLCDANDLKF